MKKFDMNWLSKYRTQLMGLSIISIMLFHWSESFMNSYNYGTITCNYPIIVFIQKLNLAALGSIGVEVFLFLSGMGLWYSYSKREDPKEFYTKRIKRIVIPYLLWASIYLIIQDLYFLKLSILDYFLDLSFILFITKGSKLFWYIGLTIFLYLLYPLIYKIFKENRYIKFIVFFVAYFGIVQLIYTFDISLYNNTEIALTRIPIFVLGSVAAKDIKEGKKYNILFVLCIAFICVGFKGFMYFMPEFSYKGRLTQTVFSIAIMIFGILFIRILDLLKINYKILNLAGVYSLELFMAHICIRRIFGYLGHPAGALRNYPIIIVLSIFIAYLYKKVCNKIIK